MLLRRLAWATILCCVHIVMLPAESVDAQFGCPAPVGLSIGTSGYVLPGPSNAVRDMPGTSAPSRVIGQIPGGNWFTVLDGPRCADGYNWWLVESNGLVGWTADADRDGTIWVSPYVCANGLPSRLRPGTYARVTPGDPNTIRSGPNGYAIGSIPGGASFSVTGTPRCGVYGLIWWPVYYNGVSGWTAEGQYPTYWLEPTGGVVPSPPPTVTPQPVACSLAPRLSIGTSAVVTPGDPNALRNRPGLNRSGSQVIGNLPAGTVFTVTNGPVCQDGHHWYEVNANGRIGWTAEGDVYGPYWLKPVTCGNGLISRLSPGQYAQVTPGLPNRIRTNPSEYGGFIIGRIPAGGVVRILSNFSCDNLGRTWWLVSYNGIVGWTAEGDNGNYWLAPR